jgi:transcriptional regulator with XRE-family HTH domain
MNTLHPRDVVTRHDPHYGRTGQAMGINPRQEQNTDEVQSLRQEAGRWLRQLRETAGLSQRDLARALDLEYYTFISQIEAGRGRVPPNQYAAMARALRVEPYDFARAMLRFYDPVTHGMLFGAPAGNGARPVPTHAPGETPRQR